MKNLHKQLHKKYLILPWKKKKIDVSNIENEKDRKRVRKRFFSPKRKRICFTHLKKILKQTN